MTIATVSIEQQTDGTLTISGITVPVAVVAPPPVDPPAVPTLTGQTLIADRAEIHVDDVFNVTAALTYSDGTSKPVTAYRLYGYDTAIIALTSQWSTTFRALAEGVTTIRNDNAGTTAKLAVTVLPGVIAPPPVTDPPPVIDAPRPADPPKGTTPPKDPPPPPVMVPPPTTERRAFSPAELHWRETASTDVLDFVVALDDGTALVLPSAPLGLTPLRNLDGTPHSHLAVCRYKDGWCIENSWLNSTQNLSGQVTVVVNGVQVFDQPDVKFWLFSRTVPQRAGLPQYAPGVVDKSLLPAYGNPGPLKSLSGVMNTAEAGINGKGYSTYDAMGSTGGRIDIGLLPAWDLPYALQGTFWQDCRDANDHAAVWPVHARDPATGMPVDPRTQPVASLLDTHRGYNYGKGHGVNPVIGKTTCPYKPDSAHQTHFAVAPYLATQSDFDMEELAFWSSFQGIWNNASYRGYEQGWASAAGARGLAWSLTQYGYAAKLLPDGYPLKASFRASLKSTAQHFWVENYAPGMPKHNQFGFFPDYAYLDANGDYRGIAPWQNHYLAAALNLLVWYGFDEYTDWRDYCAGFAVNCMTKMCYQMASFYNLWPVPADGFVKGANTLVDSWEALRLESLETAYGGKYLPQKDVPCGQMVIGLTKQGDMSGATGGPQSYPATIQQALAAGVDAGLPGADEAWALHQAHCGKINWLGANEENIVPRKLAVVP